MKTFSIAKHPLQTLVFLGLVQLGMGCSEMRSNLDARVFRSFGKTIFQSARETTIKNIHLDYQGLEKSLLIVQGLAENRDWDKDFTFFVLSDSEAQIIVKLTRTPELKPDDFGSEPSHELQVLGQLDRTDKSIPVLLALSVRKAPPR